MHHGAPPVSDMVVPYSMLLNLASAANASDKDVLWGFIRKYAPETGPATHPGLDAAAGYAIRYFEDFVRPAKTYRLADEREAAALGDLRDRPSRPALSRLGAGGRLLLFRRSALRGGAAGRLSQRLLGLQGQPSWSALRQSALDLPAAGILLAQLRLSLNAHSFRILRNSRLRAAVLL
jgi:hypothetical protein